MADGIDRIVDRQVRAWERERLAGDSARAAPSGSAPCITVSREFGTLGARVGEIVAERLGFAFDDQEVINRIAKTEKVRRAVLDSVDERVRDRISEWIAEQFGGERLTSSRFLDSLTRVIMTIGHHGKAVIIGRGSQFILDPDKAFRVRAYAPMDFRVRHIAKTRSLSAEEARAMVIDVDAQRRTFYEKYFDRDWTLPEHYDLLINMQTNSVENAACLVVEAYRMRFEN